MFTTHEDRIRQAEQKKSERLTKVVVVFIIIVALAIAVTVLIANLNMTTTAAIGSIMRVTHLKATTSTAATTASSIKFGSFKPHLVSKTLSVVKTCSHRFSKAVRFTSQS